MEILAKYSDKGTIRRRNEDVVECLEHPKDKNIKLLVLCDGMGGKEKGEIAASICVESIVKWFNNKDVKSLNSNILVTSLVKRLIKRINTKIIKEYGENHIGTTLSMAIVNKKNTIVFNCGDSRVYTYNKSLEQVSEDDSDVWYYYKYGGVDKDDLRYFATSNIINACIGINKSFCRIHSYVIPNDYKYLLLFSDGVTDILTDKKITKIIKSSKDEELIKNLVLESVYVDQHLFVPSRLKKKFDVKYIVPFNGRDNSSGVVYKR